MSITTCCESLERRGLFAAAASSVFDPAFLFDGADLRRIAGNNTQVHQAVPAPGDRTILLAERFADPDEPQYGEADGLLTLVAVTADGRLDPAFGTGGVALTQRGVAHSIIEAPGLLRLDAADRLYFSDGKRVMRFRKNGTADTAFGDRGVVQFAPDSRPVKLCDLVPDGDGVYLATTATKKGVQSFAVQWADGRRVRTVFTSADELGVPYLKDDGSYLHLDRQSAVFARSAGGVAMARLQSDVEEYDTIDGESGEPATSIRTVRQDLIVTRFGKNGRGKDVARMEPRDFGGLPAAFGNMLLSPTGKTVLVRTNREVLRLNLSNHTGRRYDLPGDPYSGSLPSYELMPDGRLYLTDWTYDAKRRRVNTIARFLPTGQADPTFGRKGVLAFRDDVLGDGLLLLDSIYVGDSGRLYVLARGSFIATELTTIHRV